MARRRCATRSPRRSRPSLTSCVDRSPGTKALRCHSTLNCGLTLAWLCTSVNLTARGSVAATRTPTACYVSTSRRAQISPDTPPTISLLSLPTSTAALARPSDGRPLPRRWTSIYYPFNQPALRRPLESAQLTIHADRGSAMRSKPVAFLLSDLAVTKTHSRPYTSTDNPYSEAQFKTLKYRPGFPARFTSILE